MVEFEIAAKLLFFSLIISFVFFVTLFLLSWAEERKQAGAGQDSTPALSTPHLGSPSPLHPPSRFSLSRSHDS
jgi:hypothetical protein